jgi:CRISPR-associated protein Cmr6
MREKIAQLREKRATRGQHAGLLLQRYLSENATGDQGNAQEKLDLLEAAIAASANEDLRLLYQEAFVRWDGSLPKRTVRTELQTEGRLIVGLGTSTVLETGIRLHHTYGLPLLPGSGLKGLAAHYCAEVWGETDEKFKAGGDYHQLLFGTTDESGCIIFHDAFFIPDSELPPLKLDVMTPHHLDWLDKGVPPTDFDSPTPVPFLSVTGRFLVAVSWSGPGPDQQEAIRWTALAGRLLKEALGEWGVGGKTTSGYGRLVTPPPPPPPPPFRGKSGDVVEAVLLAEKTRKGGWRAQIRGYAQVGPINNPDAVPSDLQPGDTVQLIIASNANDREVIFKWPLPSDQ